MRVTVCETPHDSHEVQDTWEALCRHTREWASELVILPEFAFLAPVWEEPEFRQELWDAQERSALRWIARLQELGGARVIGAFPESRAARRYNQGFMWSAESGYRALRSKRFLPDEPGGWEARWFAKGDAQFPVFAAGALRFGLNICTELWAFETLTGYAASGVQAIVTPRATAAATTERWFALAKTVAVRVGAFSLSSNRRHADGTCGGAGWILDPEGRELGRTSAAEPFLTRDIALDECAAARKRYPRYVFAGS